MASTICFFERLEALALAVMSPLQAPVGRSLTSLGHGVYAAEDEAARRWIGYRQACGGPDNDGDGWLYWPPVDATFSGSI